MSQDRIDMVAEKLYREVYEDSFGGKIRGRFSVSREHVKRLLGVRRLSSEIINMLSDACLEQGEGLVMADLDDTFAFCEKSLMDKWRRVPQRLVEEKVAELDAAENLEEDEEDDTLDNVDAIPDDDND